MREDYDYVQCQRVIQSKHLRCTEEKLIRIMDDSYSSVGHFLGDSFAQKSQLIKTYDVVSDSFAWMVKIPSVRFVSVRNLEAMVVDLKQYFIEKLTESFRHHIADQIFKLDLSK
jgi:hypothetical protein